MDRYFVFMYRETCSSTCLLSSTYCIILMYLLKNYLVGTDQTYSKMYISDKQLRLNFVWRKWPKVRDFLQSNSNSDSVTQAKECANKLTERSRAQKQRQHQHSQWSEVKKNGRPFVQSQFLRNNNRTWDSSKNGSYNLVINCLHIEIQSWEQ